MDTVYGSGSCFWGRYSLTAGFIATLHLEFRVVSVQCGKFRVSLAFRATNMLKESSREEALVRGPLLAKHTVWALAKLRD